MANGIVIKEIDHAHKIGRGGVLVVVAACITWKSALVGDGGGDDHHVRIFLLYSVVKVVEAICSIRSTATVQIIFVSVLDIIDGPRLRVAEFGTECTIF